jgi:formylglycine-generating enzyme required for sulfatase activity
MENASWDDAQEFILKLNFHPSRAALGLRKEGTNEYRLPTEAEWEYACRAGRTTAYCFGNDPGHLGEYAWYDDNSEYDTHPVGLKKPNDWGLFDMHGNVFEWVQDCFGDYTSNHLIDPKGVSWNPKRKHRVLRGGNKNSSAGQCRSASRSVGLPDQFDYSLGFRLLRTP